MTDATGERVDAILRSKEPMKVARHLLREEYATVEGDRSTLLFMDEEMWSWTHARGWEKVTEKELERDVARALEDLVFLVRVDKKTGDPTYKSFGALPGSYASKVKDVRLGLESLAATPVKEMPFWRHPTPADPTPTQCVAFRNCVLYVGEDGVRGVDRDDRYVTGMLVDVDYVPGAECPRWMQCLEEWGGGEEGWAELLQRWWGYCLLPTRGMHRWFYMYGKVRGGKGVNMRLMSKLMGGHPNFVSVGMEELAEGFGMDGLEHARVMAVPEVSKSRRDIGEVVGQKLKKMIGEDSTRINKKYGAVVHGVKVNPAVWVSGNEILRVSNTGEGLSSKMVPLWFRESFLGKEDVRLEEKLWEEREGILAWAVEGAIKLLGSEPGERWPLPQSSQEVRSKFRLYNNPLEQFMESCFVMSDVGFVGRERVLREWQAFASANKIGDRVQPNQLLSQIEQDVSWNVFKQERDGVLGLRGVMLRKKASKKKDL